MSVTSVTWEDEENNRHVEFSVAYAIENNEVTVGEITPKCVAFLCDKSARPIRSIGVHTATGRKLLSGQFAMTSTFKNLKASIAQQSSLTA